jgi:hypothetical protein
MDMRPGGTIAMSRFCAVGAIALACAPLFPAAQAAQVSIPVNPNIYVDCAYRMAVVFPMLPKIRDMPYTSGGMTVPAREFYYENGMDRFSVTIADFSKGPAVDDAIVENAATAIRRLGDVKDQFPEDYAPGIPGRQLDVIDAGGRQHRASIYMADHYLHIAETNAAPGDFAALQFEQSMLVLGADGKDQNDVPAPPTYACGK